MSLFTAVFLSEEFTFHKGIFSISHHQGQSRYFQFELLYLAPSPLLAGKHPFVVNLFTAMAKFGLTADSFK